MNWRHKLLLTCMLLMSLFRSIWTNVIEETKVMKTFQSTNLEYLTVSERLQVSASFYMRQPTWSWHSHVFLDHRLHCYFSFTRRSNNKNYGTNIPINNGEQSVHRMLRVLLVLLCVIYISVIENIWQLSNDIWNA